MTGTDYYMGRYRQKELLREAEELHRFVKYRREHPRVNRSLAWVGHRLESVGQRLVCVSREEERAKAR